MPVNAFGKKYVPDLIDLRVAKITLKQGREQSVGRERSNSMSSRLLRPTRLSNMRSGLDKWGNALQEDKPRSLFTRVRNVFTVTRRGSRDDLPQSSAPKPVTKNSNDNYQSDFNARRARSNSSPQTASSRAAQGDELSVFAALSLVSRLN